MHRIEELRVQYSIALTPPLGTVPGDLLTETILTVADVIWGQPASQLELATAVMPGDKRSAVETLLVCMLNDKQVLVLTPGIVPYRIVCSVINNM